MKKLIIIAVSLLFSSVSSQNYTMDAFTDPYGFNDESTSNMSDIDSTKTISTEQDVSKTIDQFINDKNLYDDFCTTMLNAIEQNKTIQEIDNPLFLNLVQNESLSPVIQSYIHSYRNKKYPGDTLLMKASKKNNADIANFLIHHGADINEKDAQDNRPLHYAASGNAEKVIPLLLTHGANPNEENKNGITPLHNAAQSNAKEATELLITSGADINAANTEAGTTVLSKAAYHNADKVIPLLLAAGAPINEKSYYYLNTALQAAATSPKALKLLLAAGADVNIAQQDLSTALHAAAMENVAESVQLLIEAGADVNARGYSGWTPLDFAVKQNAIESIQLLLAAGADVHMKTDQGRTALDIARGNGRNAAADLLIAAGADIKPIETVEAFQLYTPETFNMNSQTPLLATTTPMWNNDQTIITATGATLAVVATIIMYQIYKNRFKPNNKRK